MKCHVDVLLANSLITMSTLEHSINVSLGPRLSPLKTGTEASINVLYAFFALAGPTYTKLRWVYVIHMLM